MDTNEVKQNPKPLTVWVACMLLENFFLIACVNAVYDCSYCGNIHDLTLFIFNKNIFIHIQGIYLHIQENYFHIQLKLFFSTKSGP